MTPNSHQDVSGINLLTLQKNYMIKTLYLFENRADKCKETMSDLSDGNNKTVNVKEYEIEEFKVVAIY